MLSFPAARGSHSRPLIFGHRGASRSAPENTLAAFRRAAEMGADGVELDVHLTADGVPVVIHDARVNATTDGSGYIGEMTLAEVKELDAGAHFAPAFAGERIPTLEKVLVELGDRLLINIEIKHPGRRGAEPEEKVAELVRKLGVQERVWFSSFKPYSLYRMRKLIPEVPCGLLYGPLSPGSLLLAPITPHEALHPHRSLVTKGSVERAHRSGLRVVTWTVDLPEVARKFARWGVDVIITNRPDLLLEALA